MNYKSILNLIGILLAIFSFAFVPPLIVTFIYDEPLSEIFLYSFLFLISLGGLMWFISRQKGLPLNLTIDMLEDGFLYGAKPPCIRHSRKFS